MNCKACLELITDLARHHLVDARERDDAIEHINACELCAATLERERALQAVLLAVKHEDIALEAPRNIRANLQSAFRTQQANVVVTGPVRMRVGVAGLAAAAVLMLAVAAVSYWNYSRTPSEISRVQPPHAAATPDKGVAPVPLERKVVVPTRDRMTKRKLRRDRGVVASNYNQGTVTSELGEFRPVRMGNELATEFIPLRETRGLPPSESGQVIRIEMPRSALSYFGFSMASEQPGQKVKADVLMADDGLARAIRFVK